MSNDKNTSNIVDFPVLEPSELIISDGNTLKTKSLMVAETFGKQHKNVLAKVESLDCSEEFNRLNFKLCYENNELQNGKPQKYYEMTKDGFVFLVMSFTGKKAAQIKEAYINAFNWMAEKLLSNSETLSAEQQREVQEAISARLETIAPDNHKKLYPKAYGKIKSRFRVGTYKDIPSVQFQDVMDYIARMPFEHPKLQAPEGGLSFTPTECQHVYLVLSALDRLRAGMNDLHTVAAVLQSKPLMEVFTELHESGASMFFLRKKFEEAEEVYRRLVA